MKHVTALAAILFAALLFIACNRADNSKQENATFDTELSPVPAADEETNQVIPTAPPEAQQVTSTDSTVSQHNAPPPTTTAIDWDKKIIKNGRLNFEVKKFDEFNKDVRNKIKKYGAYVGREDNAQQEDRRELSMEIRVPVAYFDALMNELGTADSKQMERSINAEDVSEEVVDTRSRLEAKKQMRLKYLEFLNQSKNMKEVLEVQAEINSIQEEIESAAGRIQYLSKNAAYSTILLKFYEPVEGFTAPAEDNSFFKKTGEAFSWGANLVKDFVLVLVSIWPLLLLLAAGWFFWKRKKVPATVGVKP
jgi:hypothetical protein